MSFSNVGNGWRGEKPFAEYLAAIKPATWADSVCLHHTAGPSLAQRPKGLSPQHIVNIRDFYRDENGWSSGPHLFVDDFTRCFMGMTPFTEKGVHAVSFNRRAIGIEVLGNYDVEDPKSGRGLACWKNAAIATRVVLAWLKLPVNAKTVLFHRDDPKSSKTCPGKLIEKGWILGLIAAS